MDKMQIAAVAEALALVPTDCNIFFGIPGSEPGATSTVQIYLLPDDIVINERRETLALSIEAAALKAQVERTRAPSLPPPDTPVTNG